MSKFSKDEILLTFIEVLPYTNKYHQKLALYKCACGKETVKIKSAVDNGYKKSCGCLVSRKTHGQGWGKNKSITYVSWLSMKSRCYRKGNCSYHRYGKLGIKVCDRWKSSFENFLEDMGPRPSKYYTLNRKNNNDNYCPENCEWSTKKEQSRNTKTNHYIEYNGETKTIAEWAEILHMKYTTLRNRLRSCKSIYEAFNKPVRKRLGN